MSFSSNVNFNTGKEDKVKYTHGEYTDKLITYYCPECGKDYFEKIVVDFKSTSDRINFSSYTWYKCDCGADAYEIDSRLLSVIVKLNKLGFKTTFCCEGHDFEEAAYIAFEHGIDLSDIGLPHMWVSDKSKMTEQYVEGGLEDIKIVENEIIRTDMFNCPDILRKIYNNNFDIFKNLYLNSLYVWVDQLETKVLEKREEEKELQAKLAACQSSTKDRYDDGTITTVTNMAPLDAVLGNQECSNADKLNTTPKMGGYIHI